MYLDTTMEDAATRALAGLLARSCAWSEASTLCMRCLRTIGCRTASIAAANPVAGASLSASVRAIEPCLDRAASIEGLELNEPLALNGAVADDCPSASSSAMNAGVSASNAEGMLMTPALRSSGASCMSAPIHDVALCKIDIAVPTATRASCTQRDLRTNVMCSST